MTVFHVGQKVVCIDDLTNIGAEKLPEITSGETYTVRKIGPHTVEGFGVVDGQVSIWLEGIERPNSIHGVVIDFGFRPSRFRPVIERKTDISIFTDMLNTQRTGVPA